MPPLPMLLCRRYRRRHAVDTLLVAACCYADIRYADTRHARHYAIAPRRYAMPCC